MPAVAAVAAPIASAVALGERLAAGAAKRSALLAACEESIGAQRWQHSG